MFVELDIDGILVAPIMAYCLAALPIFLIIRWLLGLAGFWRAIWHPNLFEVALYMSILSSLVLL